MLRDLQEPSWKVPLSSLLHHLKSRTEQTDITGCQYRLLFKDWCRGSLLGSPKLYLYNGLCVSSAILSKNYCNIPYSRELCMRWLWNEAAEASPLYLHFSHPQEVFPGGNGRSLLWASQCSCAYLLVGSAPRRSIAPCSGHGAQQAAQSFAYCLYLISKMLTLSWVRSQKSPYYGEMICVTWKLSFRPCLVLFIVHSLYFCCFFPSLTHTSTFRY